MVDVNNLSFEINQKHILRDVSLQVNLGQFIGIIGPNGSGKTTLLNCLSGLISKINGSVLL
ncbi:MAG: ATP-binding cassette domain-containing protein, partial [Gammaproteobacteria bacterium]|nr:ATP-binding cassette domain-containing protein [Gammaproteobacteria bacterium]